MEPPYASPTLEVICPCQVCWEKMQKMTEHVNQAVLLLKQMKSIPLDLLGICCQYLAYSRMECLYCIQS